MRIERLSATLLLIAAPVAHAQAQSAAPAYPTRVIRVMVPFSPGGASDTAARILGQKLAERLSQQVIVDNRPGAGGTIGTELAAKAAPDGYNLLMGSSTEIAINPHLYRKLAYDTVRDFAPISHVASTPLLLVVHPSLPVKSVKELVALAKSRPGDLLAASSGNGSTTHLALALFQTAAGVKFMHLPHAGSSPATVSTMSGEAQVYLAPMPAVLEQARSGRLRALAVTSPRRRSAVPQLPTMIEAGVPGYEILIWNALFAPRGTPPEIIARLHAETARILDAPDVREAFTRQGAEVSGGTPEQLGAYVASELAKWAKVVAASGARID
jgi:tripartite-type tricarboxylate transporter receptor subunit TctC